MKIIFLVEAFQAFVGKYVITAVKTDTNWYARQILAAKAVSTYLVFQKQLYLFISGLKYNYCVALQGDIYILLIPKIFHLSFDVAFGEYYFGHPQTWNFIPVLV
jgi:uncharacterized membrane protein (GlpM family)